MNEKDKNIMLKLIISSFNQIQFIIKDKHFICKK